MAGSKEQGQLFAEELDCEDGSVFINEKCHIQTQDGYVVVSVCGMSLAHYAVGDRMSEAHAMVSLVDLGWAQQNEVAAAFDCSERTVRRNQRRFEAGGLVALGRPRGYPKSRPRMPASRKDLVNEWKAEGVSAREIARRLGVSDMAVRNLLRRLGWKAEQPEQVPLPLEVEGANPKLSGSKPPGGAPPSASALDGEQPAKMAPERGANPKLSGSEEATPLPTTSSLDTDPSDRQIDRVLACMGLLDDAAPLFRPGSQVPGAGVLLAIPALVDSGVFEIAREVYGSIGPAFYGLRTTLVTLLMTALLRIKRAEGLKEHSPRSLGRLLGLDRSPEVKTLRRKLARLAAFGRAAELGHALAQRRVKTRGHALGFLYVDGHVRAYHGKRSLPKTHLARMRLSMPATTDYWVNDAEGDPLFVVTTEANKGLVAMLPVVLDEVRSLVGDRPVTVVFDRGGWSPKLFAKLIASGFDILTYRKGRCRRVPKKRFSMHKVKIEGRKIKYQLADQNVDLFYGSRPHRKRLRLRQVTRLGDDGHQTQIITSRKDLSAIEVAYRMFDRWRQENFFKYLREEYALDALVDYGVEPADATRDVPNPQRKKINAELRKALAELNQLAAEYGAESFVNAESVRRTMRGFKIANAPLGKAILDAMKRVTELESKRASVPTRVPVQQVTEGEVIKLSVERKHITDLLKMVAYQAESDLLRLVTPHYRRTEDEGRTLIQNSLATPGDIEVTDTELRVSLEPLSSPHKANALVALCDHLNETRTIFPGSHLRLVFDVKPAPEPSLAFPGPRVRGAENGAQPDK
ncbi:MAG: putative transposase [Planctomycetota bacterium]|jgi:transposase